MLCECTLNSPPPPKALCALLLHQEEKAWLEERVGFAALLWGPFTLLNPCRSTSLLRIQLAVPARPTGGSQERLGNIQRPARWRHKARTTARRAPGCRKSLPGGRQVRTCKSGRFTRAATPPTPSRGRQRDEAKKKTPSGWPSWVAVRRPPFFLCIPKMQNCNT